MSVHCNMMNATSVRMFRPCVLLILCSQIDFYRVLKIIISFSDIKYHFFMIVQIMCESMTPK